MSIPKFNRNPMIVFCHEDTKARRRGGKKKDLVSLCLCGKQIKQCRGVYLAFLILMGAITNKGIILRNIPMIPSEP
jgi:hypothetical protein